MNVTDGHSLGKRPCLPLVCCFAAVPTAMLGLCAGLPDPVYMSPVPPPCPPKSKKSGPAPEVGTVATTNTRQLLNTMRQDPAGSTPIPIAPYWAVASRRNTTGTPSSRPLSKSVQQIQRTQIWASATQSASFSSTAKFWDKHFLRVVLLGSSVPT